jgi:hypothetical protein
LYQDPSHNSPPSVARKEAFLAISNLNAAFQRLTQSKSKQAEFQLIYEIVTLNQTMISAIASIGNLSAVIKLHLLLSNLIYSSKKLPIHYRCHSVDTQIEKKFTKETVEMQSCLR